MNRNREENNRGSGVFPEEEEEACGKIHGDLWAVLRAHNSSQLIIKIKTDVSYNIAFIKAKDKKCL